MEFANYHTLTFPPPIAFGDDELFQLCVANKDLNIERDKYGRIIIMSLNSSIYAHYHAILQFKLFEWNQKLNRGRVFDSSAGFVLPDGSMRSPDVAWVSHKQWNQLAKQQKLKFAPLAPEFVVEVKSPSDALKDLQNKMIAWMDTGVLLGWLVDIEKEKVYVYTQEGLISLVEGFSSEIDGGEVLPGFKFGLSLFSE